MLTKQFVPVKMRSYRQLEVQLGEPTCGKTHQHQLLPTNDTIIVSPATTQYFPVTYDLNGCTVVDSSLVTVNFRPTISVADNSVCDGNAATLTGVVDSTGGFYQWSPWTTPEYTNSIG